MFIDKGLGGPSRCFALTLSRSSHSSRLTPAFPRPPRPIISEISPGPRHSRQLHHHLHRHQHPSQSSLFQSVALPLRRPPVSSSPHHHHHLQRPVSRSCSSKTHPSQASSSCSKQSPPSSTTASSTNDTDTDASHPAFSKMPDQDISRYLKQSHQRIFDRNRHWAAEQREKDPEFFAKLSAGQNPEYLWIGCADSRIPAEQIAGLAPGEAFIHRNIANLVNNIDLNVMSVINYAVRHLEVKHIIVCGHYGCGGVKAAMTPRDLGILNPWLRNIRDVYRLHEAELDAITDETAKNDRLVELNVVEQCRNVIKSAAVQQMYAEKQYPIVHGWVFGVHDGLLKDLKVDHEGILKDIQKIYNLTD